MKDETDFNPPMRCTTPVVWVALAAVFAIALPFSNATNVAADEPPTAADHGRNSPSPPADDPAVPHNGPQAKTPAYSEIELKRDAPDRMDSVDQISFSADGKSLIVAAQRAGNIGLLGRKPSTYWIERWDTASGKDLGVLKDAVSPIVPASDGVSIIALPAGDAHDGPPFGRIGKVKLYNLARHTDSAFVDVNPSFVSGLAWSRDHGTVVACCLKTDPDDPFRNVSGHIAVWDKDARRIWERRWDEPRFALVDLSADGSTVFGAGGGGIIACKAASGDTIWEQDDHSNSIESLACSADGRYVATAGYRRPAFGLGLFGGLHAAVEIRDADTGKSVRTARLFHAGVVRPLDLAFSPDGRSLAVALGSYNRGQHWGEVRIVDVQTGETTTTLLKDHPQPVTTVACSPDGRLFAAAAFDGAVKLWQVDADDDTPAAGDSGVADGPLPR